MMESQGIIIRASGGRSWVRLLESGRDPGTGPAEVVELADREVAVGSRVMVEAPEPASDQVAFRAYGLLLGGMAAGVLAGRYVVEIDRLYAPLAALAGPLAPAVTGDNLAFVGGFAGLLAGWFTAAWLIKRMRVSARVGKLVEVLEGPPELSQGTDHGQGG